MSKNNNNKNGRNRNNIVDSIYNRPGKRPQLYLDIFNILIKPFITYFGKETKLSEYLFMDEVFHAKARSFEYLKVNERLTVRASKKEGNRKIPGLQNFIANPGDILLLRRDAIADIIDVSILDLSKEEELFEIGIYDLQYILGRSEIVEKRAST